MKDSTVSDSSANVELVTFSSDADSSVENQKQEILSENKKALDSPDSIPEEPHSPTEESTLLQRKSLEMTSIGVNQSEPLKPGEDIGSSASTLILPHTLIDEKSSLDDGMMSSALPHSLNIFLNSLGLSLFDIQRLGISESDLLKLFQQETACFSAFKWNRFEQALDNALHGLLLSRRDVFRDAKKICDSRVRPQEHSILLHNRFGLRKAYAASQLADGIRLGLFQFVRIFIVSMLLYRLGLWMATGSQGFSAFRAIFSGVNRKGIDSLTGLLAKLNPSVLKFILSSPLIIGILPVSLKFIMATQADSKKVAQQSTLLTKYVQSKQGWWPDVIRESIPLLSQVLSISSIIQKLEGSLNWDGYLNIESRQQAFDAIRQIAREGRKVPQWTAMRSLAKIAQGIGLKDFTRLKTAGYDQAILEQLLLMKVVAFSELVVLSQPATTSGLVACRSRPRRLYASYLLWWLGQSTSWWKQRIPFFLLTAGGLGLEIYFFYNIVSSLIKALNCPDKPGFQLGEGYLPWAADYTAECFTRRVLIFTIKYGEIFDSVQKLLSEIPQYHLTHLKALDVSDKGLKSSDVKAIIQKIIIQGAALQSLTLSDNPLRSLLSGEFADLSQLRSLYLQNTLLNNLLTGTFDGLGLLQFLYLSENGLSDLPIGLWEPLSQLQYLNLAGNTLTRLPSGAFASLGRLQSLDLSRQPLRNLSADVFFGLNQLQFLDLSYTPLSSLPLDIFAGLSQLQFLSLAYTQLNSLSPQVFAGLNQLRYLDLSGNQLNTSVMTDILLALPATVITLNISNNVMSDLPNNIISLWPLSLQNLVVGGNPFVPSVVNRTWMDNFPAQLTSFSLSSSHGITTISAAAFDSLDQLQFLNVSFNQLSDWPSGVLPATSPLKSLDLSWNNLTDWPTAGLASLKQLQSLTLSGNPLSNLSADLFAGLSSLQFLELSWNALSRWPTGGFASLGQLRSLIVTHNALLVDLPADVFSGLSQLQVLNISFNNFTTLPSNLFADLSQLEVLDLSNNQLGIWLPQGLAGLNQLRYLDISLNQITDSAAQNFSAGFPHQIRYFACSPDHIGEIGTAVFWNFFSCLSNLDSMEIKGDVFDYIARIGIDKMIHLAQTIFYRLLKNACEDQLCHANLPPPDESCGVVVDPTTTAASLEHSFPLQSSQNNFPEWVEQKDFYWSNSSTTLSSSSKAALALPSSTHSESKVESSLLTPGVVGATILSVTGLSILLYKNVTWIRAMINTGYRLFQRYSKEDISTASSPTHQTKVSCRYNLLAYLFSDSDSKKSSKTEVRLLR